MRYNTELLSLTLHYYSTQVVSFCVEGPSSIIVYTHSVTRKSFGVIHSCDTSAITDGDSLNVGGRNADADCNNEKD